MKRLRVLVLLHPDLVPPDSLEASGEQEKNAWKTEYDVVSTLRDAGHEVRPLGVQDELKPIRDEIESWKPDVVFNLLEQFHGEAVYDQNVASYLELLRIPYTGCNPRGLVLARGKDLSKKLLTYHRIPLPAFAVFPMRRKIRRPARLALPLIVKSLNEDASLGIAQASVVDTDEKLEERVAFIHERIGTAAIVEQYIEGREIYVGVLGNDRLRVLPIWELDFGTMAQGIRPIATERVKHDPQYQERRGIVIGPAKDLSPQVSGRIKSVAKRIYRTLELDGYARIDFRLSADGTPYYIEANPNPEVARLGKLLRRRCMMAGKTPTQAGTRSFCCARESRPQTSRDERVSSAEKTPAFSLRTIELMMLNSRRSRPTGPDRALQLPVFRFGDRAQILVLARGDDHGAEEDVVGIVLGDVGTFVEACDHSVRGRDAGDHGGELEVTVRDVDGDDSVRGELLEIDRHRLEREQVDGDRIGRERVDDDGVVACVGRLGQREPRVADRDRHRPALGQEAEDLRIA